jgi:hypothetical protein
MDWFSFRAKADRAGLGSSRIWALDLINPSSYPGNCRLVLSAQWRRNSPKRPCLYLILWLDWWAIPDKEEAREGADVIFEVPLETTLLDKAAPVIEADSWNAWSSKRGEGNDWEWNWHLSVS